MQGFGNVGSIAASLFQEAGSRIVAVQDNGATRIDAKGLDLSRVCGPDGVRGGSGGELVDDEAFWDVDCDILLLAALEGQLTAVRANRTKAKLVLEGANGPTSHDADDVLAESGIVVVPDVICNAGGVTVSYFEWVQDFSSFFWTEDEINARLDKIMVDALSGICDTAERHEITLRTATYAIACERILLARQERGLYP